MSKVSKARSVTSVSDGARLELMYGVRFLHTVRRSCAAAICQLTQVDRDLRM